MIQNLRAARVFGHRHITGFFQQRQIDIALGVAGGTGVAVPIPSAAKVTGLVDDADVLISLGAQAGSGQESAKATANDDDFDLADDRRAAERGVRVRVSKVVGEFAGYVDILIVAVRPQAPFALNVILAAQRNRVKTRFGVRIGKCCHVGLSHRW